MQRVAMNAAVKRISVLVVGWAFIVLGVIGLFLPILQGVLFLVIGLVILSSEYVWAHRLLTRLRQRFPSVAHKADEAKEKAATWMRHLFRHREPD
jgi:uncharacterized membrane protein YbaN (DUF454 family)